MAMRGGPTRGFVPAGIVVVIEDPAERRVKHHLHTQYKKGTRVLISLWDSLMFGRVLKTSWYLRDGGTRILG